MNTTQHLLDLTPRTKLRLSEIERLIRIHRILVPPPSRRALIELCEDGTLETAPRNGRAWLVYEEAFLNWVKGLDGSPREREPPDAKPRLRPAAARASKKR